MLPDKKNFLTEQLNLTNLNKKNHCYLTYHFGEESKTFFFFTFNIENSSVKDLFVNAFSIYEDLYYQEQTENIAKIMNILTIMSLIFIRQ